MLVFGHFTYNGRTILKHVRIGKKHIHVRGNLARCEYIISTDRMLLSNLGRIIYAHERDFTNSDGKATAILLSRLTRRLKSPITQPPQALRTRITIIPSDIMSPFPHKLYCSIIVSKLERHLIRH